MARRLIDQYAIGEAVEISFDGEQWLPGVVAGHAHPGVWVEGRDGGRWFVTHTRRIRSPQPRGPESGDDN